MRPHAAIACALLRATAALEAVPADAFQSVARGRVAVIDDFLARDVVAALRDDAEELWDAGLYSAPTRDTKLKRKNERFVLRGSVWRDFGIGRGTARSRVAATMDKVRDACAARLGRSDLTRTPPARHEFSYTRFAPGASLARHVDEHHEETKGTEGWRAPTRSATVCGNQTSDAPRHRRDVVCVAASARWHVMPSTRRPCICICWMAWIT